MTESLKKARAAYEKRRDESGIKRITLRLNPKHMEALQDLCSMYGDSANDVIRMLIRNDHLDKVSDVRIVKT